MLLKVVIRFPTFLLMSPQRKESHIHQHKAINPLNRHNRPWLQSMLTKKSLPTFGTQGFAREGGRQQQDVSRNVLLLRDIQRGIFQAESRALRGTLSVRP